tara:strand:+ start:2873 stop:3610 length:738 start_codon:yes stop_codon:yes gene_type:complete
MIKTSEIKITSDGSPQSFFLKKGYVSQDQNKTIDSNRDTNYWDLGRIINSAWDQADCYRYAKESVLSSSGDVLEIGCGTLVKQNKFFFEKGFSGKYFCIDQKNSFSIAAQLGTLKSNVMMLEYDLEKDATDVVNHFKNNNIDISTVICFDVIEHLFNPTYVVEMIKGISSENTRIIFSTPERDLKRGPDCMGSNKPEHVREWNQSEFSQFLEYFGFVVEDIQILNDTDAKDDCKTTMLFCCKVAG